MDNLNWKGLLFFDTPCTGAQKIATFKFKLAQ